MAYGRYTVAVTANEDISHQGLCAQVGHARRQYRFLRVWRWPSTSEWTCCRYLYTPAAAKTRGSYYCCQIVLPKSSHVFRRTILYYYWYYTVWNNRSRLGERVCFRYFKWLTPRDHLCSSISVTPRKSAVNVILQ